ncbi:MAG: Uma2 family endonuclease [Planctomycetota bacterium]
MSAQPEAYLQPAEYLARERSSTDMRHEYFRGEMFLMSGASREHNLIGFNLVGLLHSSLRDSGCEAYANDMRVKVDVTGLYTYPDLVVTCEEPRFEDEHVDTLLNPQVLVEVLSESTEAYDRGKKFEHYRGLETLREYLLVAQDRPHVERFSLGEDGVWRLNDATGLDASIAIETIGAELLLKDVYAKVAWPTPEGTQAEATQADAS